MIDKPFNLCIVKLVCVRWVAFKNGQVVVCEMTKHVHELRDPIHVFIRLDRDERKVLDSRPFQRLRHIHQLALTYLVYPGATHKRFEHSLGVMELASRVYDIVTEPDNLYHDSVRNILPQYKSAEHLYWRRVLRMAALCHDIGHLPFSHAAEGELLPEGWDHERITRDIIGSDEMESIWLSMKPPLNAQDIARIAVGPKKYRDSTFTDWEAVLSEIIVGNTFGVDRMDYLLRDSLHAGVAYGKFDHYRLIDTLRILPREEGGDSEEPTLGMESGGLQSAESLLWARYFMFSQVYCHPIRRIYDIHLKDFLKNWLEGGILPTSTQEHLALTDNDVLVGIQEATAREEHPSHIWAERIFKRKHFKVFYSLNPQDQDINIESGDAVYSAASEKFGEDAVRWDHYRQKGGSEHFPVRQKDGSILQSVSLSNTLKSVPVVATDYVFVDEKYLKEATKWLQEQRTAIIEPKTENEE